jgi:two-component system, OmpR family, sensor kinase
MFKSLFAKLTFSLLLLFILLSVLTISVTFFATDFYQQEVMQKLNGEVANHIVNDTDILQDDRVNHPALRELFHSLMVLNPSLEIYLIDHKGYILAFSAPPWKVVRLSVDVAPIKQYLSGQSRLPLRGDDPRDLSRSKVFSAASVPFKNKPNGYLYVILGGEEYDSIVEKIKNSYILSSSLLATALGIIVVFFMGVLLFSGLTHRLKKLSITVNEFEKNPQRKPDFPLFHQQGDEIDQLSSAFQNMALKIHRQLDELKTTDHLRRELVANVSHDLRTPLATLQGYIETLLIKESSLSLQERRDYLQTAIKHCTRLNKLVAELFELARLDACETQPQEEVFNLAELVEDVIQKFSLSGKRKDIKLQADYTSTALFVYADISLITRVLENLLENSLRFVMEGGSITIALLECDQQIQVQVSDDGIGIPEGELALIFDRFYQLDKNRNVENGNSGLGLAIVKRILELHNSMISVSSIPGQQTTFSFSLPASSN